MKVLNKLDSLDNINDGETRKLPTKTSQLTNDSGYITSANVPTKVSELQNDSGYITDYTETDPVFSASAAAGITNSDISKWNDKLAYQSWDTMNNVYKVSYKNSLANLLSVGSEGQININNLPTDKTDVQEENAGTIPTTAGVYHALANKQDKITSSNKLDYSLVSNTPTIPTVNNGTLTIQKNGSNVSTFTANQSGNSTANITVPTKTSELTNDSNFNYSIEKATGTIDDLAAFTSGKPGLTGSINITKKDSGVGSEIPAGWYNFIFSPHRTGVGGDNGNYGNIILMPMNSAGSSYILRRSNNTTTITDVKKITTSSDLSNYIVNSNSYINTHPENNPVIIPFIHNDIAFLLKRGGSAKILYDNVEQSLDISNVFDGSGSYWGINPTGTTTIVIELTLHKTFTWTNTIYCDFGAAGWRSKSINIEVMNTNYSGDTWTSKYSTTTNSSGNVKIQFTHTPVGASNAGSGFNKIKFTFSNWNNATIFRIAQLGVYNYGSQGVRETFMSRGIDDAIYRNITPNNNNTFNLGSSSNKWNTVYATTFNGNATSATKATGDKNGNDITTTYATKTELENFSRNDLAILNSKTYTGLYGSANDQDGASFYFASVRPTNFYDIWKVKYKVYANVPNQNNYKQYSIVEVMGNQDNFNFSTYNRLYSGNYRCYLYHNVYKLNSTGYNAGYGHALGIGLRGATNPTSSDYPRTVKIELLETENCTVTLLDTAVKRTGISGQGSTNFVGVTEFNGGDNGLQETGDATNTWQLRRGSGSYLASTALYRYMMLLTKNETTLIPMNAVNNSTATTKTLTTEEFDPFGAIYFYNSATTVNANASINAGSLYYQCTFDLRYSFNTGTTLTSNKTIYLVAVPQSNGKAKLYSSPITQTLPTSADGRIYIYLGHAYNNYQIELDYNHPVYEYKDGAIRLYTNAAASGGGTITDVQVDGNSIVSNGVANLNTSGYNADNNPLATAVDIQDLWDGMLEKNYTLNNSTGTAAWYEDSDKPALDLNIENEYYLDLNSNYIEMGQASSGNSITISSSGVSIGANQGDVSISNVKAPTNNKSAANKQYVDTQVATKQNTLVSGTNIKTINNQSLLGSGNINIASGNDTLPIGAIVPFSGDSIPTNYLLANGSAVSRTTYSELFDVIGTTYGAGDGSTTFNLPNLKGKVPVGRDSNDTSFDVLGETGGEKTHQLTIEEMPLHDHNVTKSGASVSNLILTPHADWNKYGNADNATGTGNWQWQRGVPPQGGSQSHNNLQPYITQNYIIKAKMSTSALDLGLVTDTYSDSTTDAYSANYVNNLLKNILLDNIYPIGSIYMSINNTNPSRLFGGTWESWGAGRVPVGVDANDTDFDMVEETGGEKTHTLTTTEMPSHGHGVTWASNCGPWVQAGGYGQVTPSATSGANRANLGGITVNNTGGGGAHNNLQPYITCYMWKRTA